jgi:voltage-gated potassium channel
MYKKSSIEASKTIREIKIGLLALSLVVLLGSVGYSVIEHWNFFDSVYMTIISITTTGFQEVHPLSYAGKALTIIIIIMGVGSLAYIGGKAVQTLIETQYLRRRRMSKKIEELNNHFIVCGYGRMGRSICEELAEENADFVVIENNPENIDRLIRLGYLFINEDATSDETLLMAGVKRAKGLVAVLMGDAENVFATLSAKVLNPSIFIVARAVEDETESKLIKAGASRVVKPYEFGGKRMAELLLRPGVVEFIDIVARERKFDLNIEQINVEPNSALLNKTLEELPIRKELNVIIVSVFKKDGKVIFNPISSTVIESGDKLFALGEKSSLLKLREIAAGKS